MIRRHRVESPTIGLRRSRQSAIARYWLAFDLTGSSAALGGVLIGFVLSSVVEEPGMLPIATAARPATLAG